MLSFQLPVRPDEVHSSGWKLAFNQNQCTVPEIVTILQDLFLWLVFVVWITVWAGNWKELVHCKTLSLSLFNLVCNWIFHLREGKGVTFLLLGVNIDGLHGLVFSVHINSLNHPYCQLYIYCCLLVRSS